eukprot:CAMPEP_0178425798 /NCGR_PEP_ID=MMETSP0689_2-20121128/28905_1 /TAXON_ID=160604 /ORGANISM="Amphidinium massartii, Strain CS-259" /LENGTH=99 /DNA_ID=CAMNT_0020047465 /DNA_START=174 /DNA_END=473 /DNA_ORIENTATION=-
MAKQAEAREAALHSEMKSMMEDDDAADASAMSSSPAGKQAFLQARARADVTDYLGDSASSLSAALGPRWDAQRLESEAKAKTDALLQAIAGHGQAAAFA